MRMAVTPTYLRTMAAARIEQPVRERPRPRDDGMPDVAMARQTLRVLGLAILTRISF